MPRWGFWKGLFTGALIEVPVLAVGVWVLARLGVGDRTVPFVRLFRLTAIFAGIAAVLTAGGLGRLAAHASVTKGGGRLRAVWVAARAHAVASMGLVLIAAIPHGDLPARGWAWGLYGVVGALCGIACGAVIGLVCGGAAPVGMADVWSLARFPGGVIKSILAPDDLLRLGVALRERTSHLLEGMFDPAEKAPDADGAAAPLGSAPPPAAEIAAVPPPIAPARRRRGAKPTAIPRPAPPSVPSESSDARSSESSESSESSDSGSADARSSDARPSEPSTSSAVFDARLSESSVARSQAPESSGSSDARSADARPSSVSSDRQPSPSTPAPDSAADSAAARSDVTRTGESRTADAPTPAASRPPVADPAAEPRPDTSPTASRVAEEPAEAASEPPPESKPE